MGYRTAFAAAILILLSSFAKETATVMIDLPQAIRPIMAPTTVYAAELPALTRNPTDLPTLGPVVPAPAIAIKPTRKPHLSALAAIRTGMASWYGKVLQDHFTASGKRFDMNELTAAHRDLPFGSKVKVTDLRNHKSVIVTITDRGTLAADRVIDLSFGAAEKLDMIRSGVDPVRLDVLTAKQALLAEELAEATPIPQP